MIALLLVVCLLFSLAACGNRDTGDGGGGNDGSGADGTLQQAGYVFVPEFIDLDIPGQWPHLLGIQGETLYIQYSVMSEDDSGFGRSSTALATMRTDGSGFSNFWTGSAASWQEDDRFYDESEHISAVVVRSDGGLLAVRSEMSSMSGPDEWDFQENNYLMAFAPDGRIEREVALSELLPEFSWISRIHEMPDGRILIVAGESLFLLQSDWTVERAMPWPMNAQNFIVANDQLLVSIWDFETGEQEVRPFDLETGMIAQEGESLFAMDFFNAQIGVEYDLYVSTGTAVLGLDLATGRSTELFEWMDIDVMGSPAFAVADTGEIFFFEEQWGQGGESYSTLVRLTKRDAATVPERIELIYGGIFIDWSVRQEIVEFNRRNTEYRIRIRQYGDWMLDDQSEAIRRLNTDIITGNAPDILDFGQHLPFERYARRGFLLDLGARIDADNGLNRGDLLEPILNLLEVDGTLYTITPQFSITTLTGRSDLVGYDMGWTMQEFLAAVAALPEGGTAFDQFITRQSFMNSVVGANLGLFIDRETGRANFDSPLFIEYLNFAQSLQTDEDLWGNNGMGTPGDWARPMPLPESASPAALTSYVDIEPPIGSLPPWGEWENPYATGHVLLVEQNLWGFNDIVWQEEQFAGPVTFKGFPSEQGIGSAVLAQAMVGISATTRHPDAAWSFVRTLLTERYQRDNVFGLATNRTILEERMASAMEVPQWQIDAGMEPQGVATQAQVDQVMALIYQVDLLAMREVTVLSIITEETLPFFAGDRGIEETVRIIQSRVQTYLSERE